MFVKHLWRPADSMKTAQVTRCQSERKQSGRGCFFSSKLFWFSVAPVQCVNRWVCIWSYRPVCHQPKARKLYISGLISDVCPFFKNALNWSECTRFLRKGGELTRRVCCIKATQNCFSCSSLSKTRPTSNQSLQLGLCDALFLSSRKSPRCLRSPLWPPNRSCM